MGWVQGLNLAPLAFIMTAAVFRSMDPSLEEAAQMHGASHFTVLRRVTLPLAWPGILAAAIYIFMTAFAAFDVPAIIGWGNRIFTFTTYLYLLLNPQDVLPRYGMGAALSTVAMALGGADELVVWRHAAALAPLRGRDRAGLPAEAHSARPARLAAWCFIGLYLVLEQGAADHAPDLELAAAVLSAAVAARVRRHLARRIISRCPGSWCSTASWNTSVLAVLTPSLDARASASPSPGSCCARAVPGRAGFDFIAFLPHAVPSIVFGVGALLLTLFVIQRAVPIYGTIWILLIVFTIARLELRHAHDQQRADPDSSRTRRIGAR